MSIIHIAHKQSDEVLDFITEEQYWADERIRELAGNRDTLDFETFADEPYSGHLESRNRLIIETREGHFAEYIIEEARQVLESDGSYTKIVYANASYSEIGKQKILPPQTFTARTASQHVAEALAGTEWQVGNVDFNGVATMTLDQHTNAYAFLQRIATEFNFELVFRVEHNGHRITGRYVDLVKTQGKWQGYEIVVGHNLKGFERIRKSGGIVTALIGVGPEITDAEGKNTGERHIVFVEDEDALQRWGRNGIHLVDVYEPQSDDQEMTENELRKYTRTELNKRTNAIAEYTADVDTLADMAGVDSGEIRFGDYVRVKDEWFSPPLYVAARIHSMTESIKEHGDVQITLGDYVEYTQDEVMALLNRFRSEINNKLDWDAVTEIVDRNSEPRRVQQATPPEDTRVIWVDTSGGEPYVAKVYDGARWVKMSPTVAGEIGAATPEEAQTIAEIEQAAVIRRIMNQSLHELDTEYTTLDGNEFLIDTPERTSLNSKKAAATTAHGKVISHIDNMLADGEISTAERSTFVTLIQAAEDAFAEYRAALAVAHDKVAAGRAKVAEDKAALAEKAAEDAQADADTALSGLLTKIDESTYNKKVGELEAAIAEAGDTTEIDAALTTLQGEIDAAEAELAKVDGKISAAKQAMATDATNKANAAQTAAIEDAEGKLAAARTALETAISDAETAAAETAIADAEAKLAAARTEILSTASTDAQTKATAAKNAAIKDAETKLAAARAAIDTATQEAADAAKDAAIKDAEGKIAAAKTSLETAIGTKADADSVYSTTEVDNALAGKVSTTTYTTDKDGIVSRLDSAETSISQNATAIQSKASTETVDTIAGRVETAETTLTQHAKALTSKAETSVVNALTGRVDTAETTISQHATAIESKASQSSVNALDGRVESAETTITQHAGLIASKAEQSELDTVSGVASSAKTTAEQTALALTTKAEAEEVNAIEGRVTSAETTISQHATAISSKAEKTELDTVSGVATSAQTLAEQTAEGLKSKASTASVNTLSGRVDTAESTLEQHAGLISSKVAQTTFETELGKKEGSIPKGTTPPTTKTKDMLWLDTSSTPNVMKRWSGTAWVKATPTTAAEVGAYSSSAGSALAGRVTTTESTIEQHAGLIASKVEKTTFDAVEGRLDTAETTISQHATAISSKASASSVNSLSGRVDKAETTITQHATAISSKAEQSSLDTVSDTATSAMTLAEQTAEGLKSKASTSSVNTLTGRVDEAESTIEQHAGLIASKVEQETFDAVEGRVDKAETTLTQHATAISSKASQSALDTVSGVASSAKTTAEQTANALKSKAETSVVNTLTGRVETAESTLEQHAGLIASKVEQETFDAVEGRLDTAETTITQHATAISSKAEQSSLDTVSGIASSAKTTAEQTANALKSKAETSTVNAIAGRVDTAETTIEQHAGLIASKAEQTSLDTVSGIATSAKTTAEQTAEALKSKAETSTVNTLTGRVETAETTIGQHATAISSKAEKSVVDTVSGTATSALTLAEQTAEGLKSKAEKTEVTAAVEGVEKYVQSRGENLVTNGTGLLGDNTNFKSFTFDGSQVFAGGGSFFTDRQNGTLFNDELVPIDSTKTYRHSLMAKSALGIGKYYFGFVSFDIDGYSISPYHFYGSKFNVVELTRDFKPGDTVIHVTDASEFNDSQATPNHYHSINFYGYKNSFGYEYPAGTYTRRNISIGWEQGAIDRTNNTITLRAPNTLRNPDDPEGIWRAGHKVSPTHSGSGYQYSTAANVIVPSDEWTYYEGIISGTGIGNNKFPPGTAFIKSMFLTNRSTSGGQAGDSLWVNSIALTDISMEENAKDYADTTIAPVAETVTRHSTSIEQNAEAIRTKAEKSELDTVSGVANSAKTTAEQTAEGLKSKAETATVNAIDGRLETAEGTIEQHATAISQRVTTATHNALAGRVSTAEGQITTMAGQIELKASSESVQQLGDRVDGVEESVTSSEVRISDVELQLGEGAITSTVLNSVQFETMFAQKANAEDLAGYATSDAVENLVNTVEGMGEDIRGIQSQEFVTQTEIEQRDLSLITTISASSGVNLLRNSVGLAGLEHWAIAGDGTVSPTGSTELNALGYHSGFLLEGASSGVTRLTQDVSVLVGKSYTLSFALRNVNTNGNIQVNVIDAIRGTLITTAPAFTETGAGNYGNVNVTVDSVPSSQLRIEIVVPAAKNAIITALMLNIGTVPFAWTTAVGELYNTTMKVDLNGIRVSQYDADIETGFTVMTPRKFAGYYNESGFIDETTGSDDEVFRVDRDEFVMKKATVSGEITMGTYKIIPIDTTSRKGWAFVPN